MKAGPEEKHKQEFLQSETQPLGVIGCVTQQLPLLSQGTHNLLHSKILLSLSWLTRLHLCLVTFICQELDEISVLRTPNFNCPLLITQIILSATWSDSTAFSGKGNYSLASVLFHCQNQIAHLIISYKSRNVRKNARKKNLFTIGPFFVLPGALNIMKNTMPVSSTQLFGRYSHVRALENKTEELQNITSQHWLISRRSAYRRPIQLSWEQICHLTLGSKQAQ